MSTEAGQLQHVIVESRFLVRGAPHQTLNALAFLNLCNYLTAASPSAEH